MKSIKIISFFVILAFGLMLLMALTTQAAVSPTQILDSAGDISWYDFSGDYVAYTNSPHPPKEVKLYNYKTDTVTNIQEGGNPTLLVAIDGNTVLYTTYDIVLFHNGKIMLYDIPSGSKTQIDTYLTYMGSDMDIGGNHVMYDKTDSVLNEYFVYVKTLSGTTVWKSSNMISESTNSFNINNGYAMFCADRVHVYDIAAGNHFTISVASDAFMAENVDTDGTTVIFHECGDYPNEFERMVTYDIASGARNSFDAPGLTSGYKIDNGKIYYIDGQTSHLYWMNIDGTGVEQVSDTPVGGNLIVENGKAVLMDPDDQSKLWLFDTASQRSYWYVDGTVAGPGDGTSPDKAFRTIQAAIDAAGKNDEIWLKKGTYELSSQINVDKAVAIYGGFAGGETQRDQRDYSNNVTTIDGQGSVYHCFYITADATIDGLTITGGNADGSWPDSSGGGIFNDENSSSTITNCTFSGNSADDDGGGIYNEEHSSPTITNCDFLGNSASWGGGGISNYNSSPAITNCSFTGNSADAYGGGINNCDNSSPTITNCSFTGNSATDMGGAILNFYNSSPTITSCAFSGNSADADGGGIENSDNSSPTITNCSFTGNTADAYGGGIDNFDNSSPTITNCILWGNTATTDGPEIYNYDISSSPLVTYCDIQGGYPGEGNINADPLFVDPSNNDFHLQATSPCIDKGNNSAPEIPNTDFEGDTRIVDGDNDGTATVDMGMDEYTFIDTDSDGLSDNWEMTYFGDLSQGPDGDYDGDGATNLEEYQAGTNPANNPPTADAGPDQSVIEGDTVTLDASNSTDSDDGIASYLWEQIDGPQVTLSSTTDLQPNFTAPSGIQNSVTISFQLTVTDNGGLHNTDTVVITVCLSPVMPSAPDGDVAPLGNRDGTVNVGDALVALRFALGLETPTQEDTVHGDVAPLDINGQPDPDGNITVGDALVILRKALGLVEWTLKPTTGDLIKSQTIGAEGGTITLDNFSLTIPSGVFDFDVELELYDLTGSLAFDEGVVTEAFRLEGLPDDYTQPLIPDIKYSGTLSDESFIVVGEKVLIPSLSKKGMAYHLFPAADSSNFLTYSPAGGSRSLKSSDYTSRSNSSRNFLDFFGITGWSTYKANENLRSNGAPGHFVIRYPSYWVSRSDIDPLFQYLEEAYTTYENMGFSYGGRTSWPIEVTVMNIPSGEDGLFCKSLWGNNSSTLQFEQKMLNNLSGLRKTAGHEFFHFIQYLYDSRNNISRNNDYFAYTISLHWLNEATAVWAEEKFSNTPNYVSPIRDGHQMAPFDGMETGTDGNIKQAGYHGYGMSAFIKYLVSKYGESILRDIYLKILDQKHPVEAINLSLNINNNLFMIWEPFLREYVTGNIYNVQKARFTANKSGLFRIQSDTDRSNTFTENYSDLSAKLFMIRLDYPEIDKAASINLKIDQGVCDITAFKFKDNIQYLDHSSDKKLTIPDIRKLTDEGYNLLVMVTNSNYFSPYTNSKAIKLDITVSLPGTVTVSAASDKIVADGTTSTLITAVVKDMDGNNIDDGTKVEFATTGGTLSGTSATTTNGEATVTLTSPTTIGSADITATVGKISGSTKVDFIAGPVTTLTLSASPNTLPADGTSTSTIQITAKDINGNPVADESIGLTASSGSLSAASAKTDESGVATITYTAPGIVPEGGTVTVTATTNNITSTTVITINQVPPWDVWPDPQWCPKTGSMHFIDYPDEKPSRIYCYYYADGTLKIEEPKFMFKVSDTYYNRWYGIFKTYYQNGNLERFITYDISGTESIKDGTETWYYENGNVYYESSWKNDILDGAVKKYAEDGTITMSSYYHNGQKDGKETLWDDKHIKVSETNYKDGKKDGLQTIYDSNGNIESETYYTQDVKNGAEKLYYSTTGIVKAEYNYSNGKFDGLQKSYNSDGSNSSETRFTDGVRNGIQKFYSATGIMESEVNYTNGEKDGIEILYNPSSGKVEEKIPWEMGLRNHNGVHELYYANGQLRLKTPYNSAGEVDGVVTEYYENGVIKRTQAYKSGELDGQVKEYDDNGEMTDCSEYADGQYIKSCMPEK